MYIYTYTHTHTRTHIYDIIITHLWIQFIFIYFSFLLHHAKCGHGIAFFIKNNLTVPRMYVCMYVFVCMC